MLYNRNTDAFKQYGLIAGNIQIQADILLACTVINSQNVSVASKLIAETIAIESMNGTAKDYNANYGEGLTQFDKGTFEDIKSYYSSSKWDALRRDLKILLFIDIENAKYSDLRKRPLLSIVFARLLYLRVPEAIPETRELRYNYYKKYFNSILGASTFAKWQEKTPMAVI